MRRKKIWKGRWEEGKTEFENAYWKGKETD